MDSNDQERERGITILAKAASVRWKDVKMNLVDTPGHADFGGEVERGLSMVDGIVLLVDASEGPLPQTRFVLRKALNADMPVVLVVNKTDRGDARISEVVDKTYELFMDLLDDSHRQDALDFPVVYASGKAGVASLTRPEDGTLPADSTDLEPLFKTILETIPAPTYAEGAPLQAHVTNLDSSPFLGRLALLRIHQGTLKKGQTVAWMQRNGDVKNVRITELLVTEEVAGANVLALGAALLAARVAMCAVGWALLRRVASADGGIRPAFDWQGWKGLQAAALPLGFFMISLNLYNYVDTIILGALGSNADTGWYGGAYRIYEGLTYPPSIIASLATPRLSHLFVHDRTRVRGLLNRALTIAAVMGLLLGGLTVVAAEPIVRLLFGAEFLPAAAPLRILAGGAVFVFCTWILHAAAIATNLDRRLFLTTVVGLTTNVGLNLVLIPIFGIRGAAAATVAAEAVTVALLFAQLVRHLGTER